LISGNRTRAGPRQPAVLFRALVVFYVDKTGAKNFCKKKLARELVL
jgi:hypothetical protein